MGTNAFPSLIEAFKDPSPLVREAAVFGVLTSSTYMTNITQPEWIIPELIPLVNDPAENVRRFAAGALGKLGPAASNAVPALSAALNEPSARHPNLTAWIATALGKIGPASSIALPRLKELLKDPDPYLRSEAAAAVWRIDRDVDTALVVLIEELPKSNVNSKWEWIDAMAEMGPRASNAFPALIRELPGATAYNREKITNALYKIDPETSAATWGK
jgi:HEAT repeat protein